MPTSSLILIILAGLTLLTLAGGYYFSRILTHPINYTYQQTLEWEIERNLLSDKDWENWPKQAVEIPSPYGYKLVGYYLPTQDARNLVVISHGITGNLIGALKYARIFQGLGFNALVYDHRNHGLSGGKNTTFGFYEQHDLAAIIKWANQRLGPFETIGLHGESMGGAIALLAAALEPQIDFVVADCSYAHLEDQLTYRLQEDYHLPAFPLLPLARIWSNLLTGMQFDILNPESVMDRITAPVLIIHGEKDQYIPPEHAKRLLQRSNKHPRDIWLAPNADHAESLFMNPQPYAQKIRQFLQTLGLIEKQIGHFSDSDQTNR